MSSVDFVGKFVFNLNYIFKPIILKTSWDTEIKNRNVSQFSYQFCSLLSGQWSSVMSLEPLSKWSSVNLNYCALGQSLGTNQFVVACIVNNIDDSCLAGNAFFFILKKNSIRNTSISKIKNDK